MGVQLEKPEDPKCIIHDSYDIIAKELHEEMQKEGLDERSFEKILNLIKTAVKLQARLAGKTEVKLAQDQIEEIQKGTEKVAAHINGWVPIAVSCLTAAIQLAGGIVGGVGAFKGFGVISRNLPDKALADALRPIEVWNNASQTIGQFANVSNSGKEIAQNHDNAKRTTAQHEVDERKRLRDERNRDATRKYDAQQEMHRSIEQANSAAHDAFSKMCY